MGDPVTDQVKTNIIMYVVGFLIVVIIIGLLYSWLFRGGFSSIFKDISGIAIAGPSKIISGITSKQTKKNVNSIGNSFGKLAHL